MTTLLSNMIYKETSDDIIDIDEHFIEMGFLNSSWFPLITEVIRGDYCQYYLFGKLKIWQIKWW